MRFAGGIALVIGGALMLSYGSHEWTALLLVVAALNFSFGYREITVARSASPRT